MTREGLGNLLEAKHMHKAQRHQMLLRNIKASYSALTGEIHCNIHCVKYARIPVFSDPLFPVPGGIVTEIPRSWTISN